MPESKVARVADEAAKAVVLVAMIYNQIRFPVAKNTLAVLPLENFFSPFLR